MKFDIETIDNIMLDIEGLSLPVEKHHPVLMLVLGAIEHYAPAPATVFSGLQPIENLPKFLRRQAAHEKARPSSKPASKTVGEIAPAPTKALASKAEGGAGILPRPCPDEHWTIEGDLDLVSEHHRGLSMLDVSVILERTRPDCVARYKALIEAMPAGGMTERQALLKKTLAYHAAQARKAA